MKNLIRKWLGVDAKKEAIDWTVIGTVEYGLYRRVDGKVEETYEGEAVLYLSPTGKRKFKAVHEDIMRSTRARGVKVVAELLTWEMGGYLPKDFKPIKGPDRKEWKMSSEVVAMKRPTKE